MIIDVHSNLRSIIENQSVPSGFSFCSYLSTITIASADSLFIPSNACNSQSLISFDLSAFKLIKSLSIGNESFFYTSIFKIDGLPFLNSVSIGINSFTKHRNSYWRENSRVFYITNCMELESINIDKNSFSDYAGHFELKNLPSLHTLNIGNPNTRNANSHNFHYCDFVLQGLVMMVDII